VRLFWAHQGWQAFFLDLVVLIVLAVGRPDLRGAGTTWYRDLGDFSRTSGPWVAGVVAFSLVVVVSANLAFGSVPDAIAYFRGDRVSVSPQLINVGQPAVGDKREVSVELTNRTAQDIRVIGGTTDCSCTVLNDLPVAIGPGETRSLTVSMTMTGRPGVFNRKANFLVDDAFYRSTGIYPRTYNSRAWAKWNFTRSFVIVTARIN
jgi:hypothetical protein